MYRYAVAKLVSWLWSNIDVALAVVSAAVAIVLGGVGVLNDTQLASFVLATLVVVTIAVARLRLDTLSAIAAAQGSRGVQLFADYPSEFHDERKLASRSWVYVGLTMSRTSQTGRSIASRLVGSGGSVRVVLLDPDDQQLLATVAAMTRPERSAAYLEGQIRHSLTTLASIPPVQDGVGPGLEVKLARVPLFTCINLVDEGLPTGHVTIQHYQYRPKSESAPIVWLRASEEPYWFSHAVDDVERIWADAVEVDLAAFSPA